MLLYKWIPVWWIKHRSILLVNNLRQKFLAFGSHPGKYKWIEDILQQQGGKFISLQDWKAYGEAGVYLQFFLSSKPDGDFVVSRTSLLLYVIAVGTH